MRIFETKLSPNDARLTCYMQDLSPEMATVDVRPAMLIVPIQNSLTFAKALADRNIFFEMHIYPIGDHGFTLGKPASVNNDSNFAPGFGRESALTAGNSHKLGQICGYHINRVIEETGVCFNDGSHIIYANGSYKDDNDPVGKLMHDFRCVNSVDMFYPELAKQVKCFKETEGGQEIMCQVFEDLAEKRANERAEEVREETRIETMFNSIKDLM